MLFLLIFPAILCILAQIHVSSTFNKYAKMPNARGITGAEAARQILDANGLSHIRVEPVRGKLTDHYDPGAGVIRLSESVYGEASAAALGVAAHECGHAVQREQEYAPYNLRTALFPVTNFCSHLWYITFVVGLIFARSQMGYYLMLLGILFFAAVALFQLVTLPVEFNASSRALKILEADGYLMQNEIPAARKVLSAAAMTYVAGLLQSLMQLLRLLLMASNSRGNRRS